MPVVRADARGAYRNNVDVHDPWAAGKRGFLRSVLPQARKVSPPSGIDDCRLLTKNEEH